MLQLDFRAYTRKKVLAIIVGSLLIAIGINNFIVPHHILDGGVLGLGLIVNYVWGWSVGLSIIVISLPIYIWSWFYSKEFFYNSFFGFFISAIFIDLFDFFSVIPPGSPLFGSIVGGALLGIGVGVMFRYDVSTGGLDLVGQMLADMTRINVGIVIFSSMWLLFWSESRLSLSRN